MGDGGCDKGIEKLRSVKGILPAEKIDEVIEEIEELERILAGMKKGEYVPLDEVHHY